MCKEKLLPVNESEKFRVEINEEPDESTWASDQEKHSYYYDDSTGYKIYNPEEDDEDDEDETESDS